MKSTHTKKVHVYNETCTNTVAQNIYTISQLVYTVHWNDNPRHQRWGATCHAYTETLMTSYCNQNKQNTIVNENPHIAVAVRNPWVPTQFVCGLDLALVLFLILALLLLRTEQCSSIVACWNEAILLKQSTKTFLNWYSWNYVWQRSTDVRVTSNILIIVPYIVVVEV